MKIFFLFAAFVISTPAFAADAIYCRENGKVVNAYVQDDVPNCAAALMQGEACFTGRREAVIALINADSFNWGGQEWLADAHFKGRDEIAYTWHDGPNELKEKLSLARCTSGFFRR
jgi:hypothetical protein